MNTCGQCIHAKIIKDNLQQRTCRGGPPQVLAMPGPGGQLAMMAAFPNVGINDEACGLFKPKAAVEQPKPFDPGKDAGAFASMDGK